ncbi:MAG TPA: hypothetical protein DE315_02915 [Candidatus Omnitrophica bacterium]|nr:MAG: hypothetical protein A2Y05_00130 [Omnitrophica WOR_2 bacterium GWA2_53_43]HBO98061.1 hypothetical protein [Candidatus Omnitrophota bacterium]HCI44472.1 hypothetical protein [Candidatus Omnitrophota bacterium]
MLRRRGKRGQSLIEYAALIVVVLWAFWVFQKYMARGFSGRWKAVGESLGQGRIYDPRLTTECIFDPYETNLWYDQPCFESSGCDCLTVRANATTCHDCIQACAGTAAGIRCNAP